MHRPIEPARGGRESRERKRAEHDRPGRRDERETSGASAAAAQEREHHAQEAPSISHTLTSGAPTASGSKA